jgi:hypothetical protein
MTTGDMTVWGQSSPIRQSWLRDSWSLLSPTDDVSLQARYRKSDATIDAVTL